jgi:hypothetical protein
MAQPSFVKEKIGAAPGQNLTVRFDIEADGTAPGTIQDDATGENFAFSLTRAAADSQGASIAPGVYTAWLPGDTNMPGTGYVVATVDKKGKAKLVGKLSDGQAFSDSSKLLGHHYVLDPLLYKNGKTYAGQLRSEVEITGGTTVGTEAEWFKDVVPGDPIYPNSVAKTLPLEGERFIVSGESGFNVIVSSLGSANVQLVLEGGNLPATQTIPISISEKKVTVGVTSLQQLSVKVDTKNGTFSGSFIHPASFKKTTFAGAFRKGQDEGRGSFPGLNIPGDVRITATP